MKKNIFTKIIIGLTTSLFALGLAGCGSSASTDTKATEKKDLTIGISPGPYSELFTSAVKPILEKNGYTIKEVNFSDLRQADVALTEGRNDVSENTYNLDITLMDSAQIPRALDDIDFAVLPGSMVYASKIDPSKSLLSEDVSKELQLQVVVDEKNKDSKWANDIVEAYKSKEFKDYMAEHNKNNYWFIPDEIK